MLLARLRVKRQTIDVGDALDRLIEVLGCTQLVRTGRSGSSEMQSIDHHTNAL